MERARLRPHVVVDWLRRGAGRARSERERVHRARSRTDAHARARTRARRQVLRRSKGGQRHGPHDDLDPATEHARTSGRILRSSQESRNANRGDTAPRAFCAIEVSLETRTGFGAQSMPWGAATTTPESQTARESDQE